MGPGVMGNGTGVMHSMQAQVLGRNAVLESQAVSWGVALPVIPEEVSGMGFRHVRPLAAARLRPFSPLAATPVLG